jgi:hypothetical protein
MQNPDKQHAFTALQGKFNRRDKTGDDRDVSAKRGYLQPTAKERYAPIPNIEGNFGIAVFRHAPAAIYRCLAVADQLGFGVAQEGGRGNLQRPADQVDFRTRLFGWTIFPSAFFLHRSVISSIAGRPESSAQEASVNHLGVKTKKDRTASLDDAAPRKKRILSWRSRPFTGVFLQVISMLRF